MTTIDLSLDDWLIVVSILDTEKNNLLNMSSRASTEKNKLMYLRHADDAERIRTEIFNQLKGR